MSTSFQVSYFTLDNATNNAVAMEELQYWLAEREINDMLKFDHLKHRVWCYAHIINICSSHIVALFTSIPKSYITSLSVPLDPDYAIYDDANADVESNHLDKLDDDDSDLDTDYKFELPGCYRSSQLKAWASWIKGIQCDPLRCA